MVLVLEANTAEIDGLAARWREGAIPEIRRAAATGFAQRILQRVIESTPVETGEARSAWNDAIILLGSHGGQSDGSDVTVDEEEGMTEIRMTNRVRHVVFLEYGTRRMAARGIVRRVLGEVVS